MTDKQRTIAFDRLLKKNPIPKPDFGPPFAPPWVAFPDYSRYSMGFRMGSGEDYIHQLWDWYHSATSEEVTTFKNQYPETEEYMGFYASWDDQKSIEVKDND